MNYSIIILLLVLATEVSWAQPEAQPKATTACGMLAPPRIYFGVGAVHFERSDSLALDTLLCFMGEYPSLVLGIYCYAEPSELLGSDTATQSALAQMRAEMAKCYLVSKGFAPTRISIRNMTSRPPLPPKGVPPLSGRRLEFYVMSAKQK